MKHPQKINPIDPKKTSFLKLYNLMDRKFMRNINKGISIAKKRKSSDVKNLIRIRRILGKTKIGEISKIQKKINKIAEIIKSKINIPTKFFLSGSITKGTYVHGLSDIDLLVLLDKKKLFNMSPKMIQTKLFNVLNRSFSKQDVKKDQEAIDIFINKKCIKIQIVPVVFNNGKIFFPMIGGKKWEKINPNKFTNLLREQDKRLKGNLTISIRIAKVILSNFSKNYLVNNHHLEILAYLSCKNLTNKSVLNLLSDIFSYAAKRVMRPIKDSSKQSEFIDEYLGPAGSSKRNRIAHKLQDISKKISKGDINI